MPLPTSPPISLTQIQDEFGAPRGTGITDFRRGGAYVPNVPANSGVPTSGAIGLLHLLGATKTTPLVCSFTGNGSRIFEREPAPTYQDMSGSTTASISGGIPPYTHSWSRTSGSMSWNVNPSNSLQIQHSARVSSNTSENAKFTITVSDSGGQTAAFTQNVNYTYETDR